MHGYLGADFDLRELPATQALYEQPQQWVQLKGDPAIRAGLFHQARVASPMDERIDEVLDLALERPLRPAAGKAGRSTRGGGRRQRPAQDQAGVKH